MKHIDFGKIFVIAALTFIIICILFVLPRCNMAIGCGNYEFNGVHICDHGGNCHDVRIINWHDNSTGIEVKCVDGNSIFLSEGTYILYEDYCPICK